MKYTDKLTDNFNVKEFFRSENDFNNCPDKYKININILAEKLQSLRDYVSQSEGNDISIFINSGYRNKSS